jgi:hypothetical protein
VSTFMGLFQIPAGLRGASPLVLEDTPSCFSAKPQVVFLWRANLLFDDIAMLETYTLDILCNFFISIIPFVHLCVHCLLGCVLSFPPNIINLPPPYPYQ